MAMTTAKALGQFRRDLEAEGFDHSMVDELVQEAAHAVLGEGLAVADEATA